MMGASFLVLFIGNNLIGYIGTFYEQLGPSAFWALHAAIGATGGVLAFVYSRTAGRLLEPQPSSPTER
jgi:POT family proton-dependent oligopeptide transporter